MLWFLLAVVVVASPVVALVAIIQWIQGAMRRSQNGGLSDYQLGFKHGRESVAAETGQTESVESEVTPSAPAVYPAISTGFIDASATNQDDQDLVIAATDSEDNETKTQDEVFITTMSPTVDLSPEQKSKRSLNILLSLGSLLFVAAGIAFVASDMPDSAKLIGIFAIVALFYLGGHGLYLRSKALRPAAVSFVGTGLALIPTLGVALSVYADVEPATSWLITSAIGVLTYLLTATKLNSQVLAYLSIAFSLSLFASGVGVADAQVFWYFVVMITSSIVMSLIATWRPELVPKLFRSPLNISSQVLAPLSIVAMLFVPSMEIVHYEIMLALMTLQYLLVWLHSKRHDTLQLVRVLASVTLGVIAWDVSGGVWTEFSLLIVLVALLQQLFSLFVVRYRSSSKLSTEQAWIWTMLAFQAFIPATWLGFQNMELSAILVYVLIGAVGLAASWVFWRTHYAYAAVGSSLVIVPLLFIGLLDYFSNTDWIAVVYAILAITNWSIIYTGQKRSQNIQNFLQSSLAIYTVATIVALAFVDMSSLPAVIVSVIAALLWLGVSWLSKSPYILVLAVAPITYFGFRLSSQFDTGLVSQYYVAASLVLAAVLAYSVFGVLWLGRDRVRRNIMLGMASSFSLLAVIVGAYLAYQYQDEGMHQIVAAAMVAGSATVLALAVRVRQSAPRLFVMLLGFGAAYLVVGLIVSLCFLGDWWRIIVLTYAAATLYWLSWKLRVPALIGFGAAATAGAFVNLASTLQIDSSYVIVSAMAATAGLNYALYWVLIDHKSYADMAILAVWLAAIAGYLAGMSAESTKLLAAAVLAVGAMSMYYEGIRIEQKHYREIAWYGLLVAISSACSYLYPELNYVFYTHLWAAGMAITHLWLGYGSGRYTRLIVGMGLLTFFGGIAALTKGGMYSLIFLIEHVALLLLGAFHNKMWAVWWGLIASTCGVLYYLKDTPFLAFSALGTIVTGFVIWRLKNGKQA